MRKNLLSIATAIACVFSAFSASAEFITYSSPASIPASVYETPYRADQFTTVYAPWMRNFHLMSQYQVETGDYGSEACQQIRATAISPANPDVMYFITNTSGIYTTKDGGKNWYNCTNNSGGYDAIDVVCDLFDENTVYAAMTKVGVQRSRDGGRTWEEIIPDTLNKWGSHRSGTMDFDREGNLYAAVTDGIYVFNRESETVSKLWPKGEELISDKLPVWVDMEVSPDGKHLYAVCNKANEGFDVGIYASHDGGASWELMCTDEKKNFTCHSVELYPEDPMNIYFAGQFTDKESGNAEPFGLYVSQDGGKTYEYRYSHIYVNKPEGVDPVVRTFSGIKFGPKNEMGIYPLYYCAHNSTYNVMMSYDYGYNFERVFKPEDKLSHGTARYPISEGKGYTGYLYQSFDVDMTRPGRLIFGAGGINEYDNGKVSRISAGFSGANIKCIAMSKSGKMIMATTDVGAFMAEQGIYTGYEYPTFGAINGKYDDRYVKMVYDPSDENHIVAYVGTSNGNPELHGIRQSYDGGKSFEPVEEETASPTVPVYGNTKFLFYDPNDTNIIYSTYHTSFDNGETWKENSMPILAISQVNTKKMLGIDGTGSDTKLYLSEDGGETWTLSVTPGVSDYRGMIFDSNNDDYVWFTRKRAFGRINVKTGAVENHTAKFEYNGFDTIAQNPNEPNHLIMTSKSGVSSGRMNHIDPKLSESRDGGETWHAVPGIMGMEQYIVGFSSTTPEIFIGTMAGVWLYNYEEFWKYLDTKVDITINGEIIDFTTQPVIQNGRTMVPMRELFEKLGATVNYDLHTGEITAKSGNNYVTMYTGSDKAILNGQEVTLDAAPYITEKGRTMVPLRFASEALDISVGWSEAQRKVIISS